MLDISKTIEAKSDQLNSDDLIGSPITVKITKVTGCDNPQQPVSIYYEGDNDKPYKPCKSMRRVLVNCWGINASNYVSRSMTLYRDADVKFGGINVGGIRISHLSHIDKPITMALTASKANKKPFTVQPLKVKDAPIIDPVALKDKLSVEAKKGSEFLLAAWNGLSNEEKHVAASFKDELKLMANQQQPTGE